MIVDRTQVTFAEAEGILPSVLQWGTLSKRLRVRLWQVFDDLFTASTRMYTGGRSAAFNYKYLADPMYGLMRTVWTEHLERFSDEIPKPRDYIDLKGLVKGLVVSANYVSVLGLVQFFCRLDDCPRDWIEKFQNAFDDSGPYAITLWPFTVTPRIDPVVASAISGAIAGVQSSGLDGSKAHLSSASSLFSSGDYAGVCRESIHAVESAVRSLSGEKEILSRGMSTLERSGLSIHPALRQGIEKLYAYTNDEAGIRHSLLTSETNIGLAEAIFMYGASASFVAYLWEKGKGLRA